MRPLFLLLLVGSCVTPPPPAPPPPPGPDVPAGCLADLSGRWVHATDPSFTYQATDDGGTLTLVVTHTPIIDAGFRPRVFRNDAGQRDAGTQDAGLNGANGFSGDGLDAGRPAVTVVLERTTHGFVGEVRATVDHPSGRRCDAHFHAELLECRDAGLLLSAETGTALGEACQPPAKAQPVPRAEQRLIRAP